MAYLQRHRLTTVADLDDDSTWRYKLPRVGKYTAFEMRINCDRYATRADVDTVHPLESCITRIEMLEAGAKIVHSLTGQHLDAMNYWDFGKPNPRRYRQEEDTGNDVILFLLGGRNITDQEYGFDMAKMAETYLNYTYNLHEDTAEYFAADDHDVTLYGYRWMGEDVPEFVGHMRTQELASWTTSAANALKTIHIPIGNRIRRVAVQATTRAKTLGGTFSKLELRANEGEYSPIIVNSMMDWAMSEVSEYLLENETGGIDYAVGTGENELPRWWSYIESLVVSPYGYAGEINLEAHGLTLPVRVKANTTGNQEFMFQAKGWGFQKCLRLGFEHDDNPAKYLRTDHLGSLDLIVTEAAADLGAQAFMQDVVMY